MILSQAFHLVVAISFFSNCAWAGPFPIYARNSTSSNSTASSNSSISEDTFSNLQYFAQYSAASYEAVNSDNGFKNGKERLKCPKGHGCPLIEKNDVYRIFGFENHIKTGVKGFIALDQSKDLTVIAFRGSVSIMNWITDLRANQIENPSEFHDEVKSEDDIPKDKNELSEANSADSTLPCKTCTAHAGFLKSWLDVRQSVTDYVDFVAKEYPKNRIVLTGHSAGGSIASLAAAEIKELKRVKDNSIKVDLYTYGASRIGSPALSSRVSNQGGGDIYRVTHRNDMVPRLPPRELLGTGEKGYGDLWPEYYIAVKGKEEVRRENVSKVDGGRGENERKKGNGRWGWSELDPFETHWYYLGNILSGMPGGVSLWKA